MDHADHVTRPPLCRCWPGGHGAGAVAAVGGSPTRPCPARLTRRGGPPPLVRSADPRHHGNRPNPLSDVVGALYHYWISACFGLTYALICGRTRWWGGLIWGLLIEVGMMTTPPMVIAMDNGYFGLKL